MMANSDFFLLDSYFLSVFRPQWLTSPPCFHQGDPYATGSHHIAQVHFFLGSRTTASSHLSSSPQTFKTHSPPPVLSPHPVRIDEVISRFIEEKSKQQGLP